MSQNDFSIANQTASNFRADLNNALQALASLSSGSTAPSTTYANMLWYDTGNNLLKMRTEADDAWINVGYLCQSTNKFCILDDTNVVNTSGTQTGRLGDQATSAWEAGTSKTESLVSPDKVKAAVEANTPEPKGMTLLGTLTTTFGTVQTLSGLDLTDYKFLKVVADDVGNSAGVDRVLRLNGFTISEDTNLRVRGFAEVELSSGIISSGIREPGSSNYTRVTSSNLSNADTSLSFTWSGSASFDEGTIRVYGVK